MAAVTAVNNIVTMTNGDTYSPLAKKIKIKGVRLVGNSTDVSSGTLTTDESEVIYALACPMDSCDESQLCSNVDADVLTAAVTGTGSYLMVYLE